MPPLRALVAAGHDVAFAVTQPDRRRGRGAATQPSPVKAAATELGIPVRTPERSREIVDDVVASGAELGVVVAFGQILPTALLDALPLGFVNLHFSLLPRWRGAAPVERAILAGDAETGVAVMRIEAGLDTGPVFATTRVPIGPTVDAGALREHLVEVGTELLVATLPEIAETDPIPQAGEPTYAEKLTVEEFRLDPARPAVELDRIVRAGHPRPGAWFELGGKRVKVGRAHLAGGHLVFDEVQPEGKARMDAAAWRAGLRVDLPTFGTA